MPRHQPRFIVTAVRGGWRITRAAREGGRQEAPDEFYVLDRAFNHRIVKTYRLAHRASTVRVEKEARAYAAELNARDGSA